MSLSDNTFASLVEEHSRQVLNLALRILGNSHAAQDVHQEVFLSIWQRRHRYDGQVNWRAYLYRTTVRAAMKFARKNKADLILQNPGLDSLVATRPASFSQPDKPMQLKELQQKLFGQLAQLPRRQAEVFVLSRLEGLKHHQIAGIIGCSEKTVRVHLHRALKRLVHRLSEFLE